MTTEKGSVSFRSVSSGVHKICAQVLLASPDRPVRISLEAETGEDSEHYDRLHVDEHLSDIQIQVLKLNDEMVEVLSEADYMKGIEVDFHNQSINMNSASKWWPIIQLCILVMMALVQFLHMRKFFEKRKLV